MAKDSHKVVPLGVKKEEFVLDNEDSIMDDDDDEEDDDIEHDMEESDPEIIHNDAYVTSGDEAEAL